MNKIRNYAYIAVFSVIIIGLGFLSYRKLTNFYINQEKFPYDKFIEIFLDVILYICLIYSLNLR